MKVSVIIPIYNVASCIIKCLDSVYNQTYSNIEVILVDDCGTDDSMMIVKQYLTSDKQRITKIIHHEKNKGLSAARNTGIRNATGDCFYLLDSDDYISDTCIASFVEIMLKYNTDVVFGSAETVPYHWTDVTLQVNQQKLPIACYGNNKIAKLLLKKKYLPVTAWNKLVRRNYVLDNGLFFKEGISYEDEHWNWMIANTINSISFNRNVTYYYRCNPSGIMHQYRFREMDSEVLIIRDFLSNLKLVLLAKQILYVFKFAHAACCRRYFRKKLPSIYIRYPMALLFVLLCLIVKPEKLRV